MTFLLANHIGLHKLGRAWLLETNTSAAECKSAFLFLGNAATSAHQQEAPRVAAIANWQAKSLAPEHGVSSRAMCGAVLVCLFENQKLLVAVF